MISPTTFVNFAAGLAQLAESRARHGDVAIDRVQAHNNPAMDSFRSRNAGGLGSTVDRLPLAHQANVNATAAAMHRNDLAEMRRNDARSMLMRPNGHSKA